MRSTTRVVNALLSRLYDPGLRLNQVYEQLSYFLLVLK
jgi:hypothetical protein